ncbi:hypothetical protein CALVIDRAFT_366151 [Calocera viscosa TUFC12733]|uniref:Uncharacterized protein n=1 Tax=Calocera viscosa (strain TUFC12733) TaxID=1330018 RepID=A0A167H0M7_CALVF|nr:hypothetical protein CALVIDRAFT_366151 [Calocera viscosa TUFC12733]
MHNRISDVLEGGFSHLLVSWMARDRDTVRVSWARSGFQPSGTARVICTGAASRCKGGRRSLHPGHPTSTQFLSPTSSPSGGRNTKPCQCGKGARSASGAATSEGRKFASTKGRRAGKVLCQSVPRIEMDRWARRTGLMIGWTRRREVDPGRRVHFWACPGTPIVLLPSALVRGTRSE